MSNPNHDPKNGEFTSGAGGGGPAVPQSGNSQLAAQKAHGAKTIGRHGYNPDAVQKAIESNNRHGPKIGGKEARMIHRLLRGR